MLTSRRQQPPSVSGSPSRSAATTVELAIVLPVLFFLVFAAVEFSRLNMLKHLAGVAAYEGARHGIVVGATVSEVEARVHEIISNCVSSPATVTTTPTALSDVTTDLSVHVSVPVSGNFWIIPAFVSGPVTSECTIKTERRGNAS